MDVDWVCTELRAFHASESKHYPTDPKALQQAVMPTLQISHLSVISLAGIPISFKRHWGWVGASCSAPLQSYYLWFTHRKEVAQRSSKVTELVSSSIELKFRSGTPGKLGGGYF